ncbi:MAG: ATP-binding protein [Proteobacteria bacterium]|nr:ATP-binding protein [Pseudomonadota bacterium]
MAFEDTPRDALLGKLQTLLDEAGVQTHERERLVHDLHVHQIELELQNRELRDAQEALEQSRDRYAELYDFVPIAYFTFDRQGVILEVNLTGATLVGRDRAQLIGLPFAALVTLVEPSRFWAHLQRCAETRVATTSELALTIRDADVHVRVVSSPVAAPDGQTVAFRTAFVDISDLHRAELARNVAFASERALRTSLQEVGQVKTLLARSLATVAVQSLDAILQIVVDQARVLVDADYAALGIAGDHGRFASWGHAGIEPRLVTAIGATPRMVGVLGAVLRTPRSLRLSDLTTHPAFVGFPANHPRMTTFLGVPVWFGDRVIGNLYLTNKRGGLEFTADDQQRIESLAQYVGLAMEIARLADKAQRAIEARDNLLATVSHDLRGPLSAIAVSSKLLIRTLPPTEAAFAHRQAATIGRASDRMSRFIDDLLTASTLDAGGLAMTVRPEPLAPIIAAAVDEFAFVATDGGLALDATVSPELPPVACDRDRVHQVLANLIGNALKLTPSGGAIRIEVARVDDEVHVSVVDTGPGIAEADQLHLFDRFWKREPSPGGHGVGLGLFICKGIVEQHHGRIWVTSTPGQGARFTFSLPVAASASAPQNPGGQAFAAAAPPMVAGSAAAIAAATQPSAAAQAPVAGRDCIASATSAPRSRRAARRARCRCPTSRSPSTDSP